MTSTTLAPSQKKTKSSRAKSALTPLEAKMLQWLDIVQIECERLIDTATTERNCDTFDFAAFGAWKIRAKLCLKELLGREHDYYIEFCKSLEHQYSETDYKCRQASHILRAIREDLESGYLRGYRGLIQAEVFSDFLDGADHLREQGYKDAAAVIAGSVLEDHLKQLCQKHSVPLTVQKPNGDTKILTASEMTEALGKGKIYELPMQQSIKSWLALRNKAAHGNYQTYDSGEVKLMLLGVRQFLQTVPL